MNNLFLGVLSGTSIDAIDIALVEFGNNNHIINSNHSNYTSHNFNKNNNSNNKFTLVAAKNYQFPKEFQQKCKLLSISNNFCLDELGMLDYQAGILFADAINDFLAINKIKSDSIKAIGSHGQTIRHQPNLKYPFSWQIGDPNVITYQTKIPVIADFRRKDIAAGGQGAPLAPILHQEIFASSDINRIIINIGGISNITMLPKDPTQLIIGFDSGPGNCLLDSYCKKYFQLSFDDSGKIGDSGKVIPQLLDLMLQDEYFKKVPPKSTGTDYFNTEWLHKLILKTTNINAMKNTSANTNTQKEKNKIDEKAAGLSELEKEEKVNIITTLTHFTAKTIADSIACYHDLFKSKFELNNSEIFVCGGGANNKFLLNLIKKYAQIPVATTKNVGLDPNWVEAVLFALLAKKRFYKESINLKSITGSKQEILLGGMW